MPSLSPRKAACRPYRADHVRSVRDAIRLVQAIQLPQEVQGGIEQGKDVDLFRFEGKEGQRITMEIFAARYGSALDSLLILYNGESRILASCDDISGSSDSRLDATLPKSGTYFVGVIDANDQNGPVHVYRLSVRYQSASARR